jgi:PHD/YefM family antitoxin component YafN of YafNO toxin-antitoxin module
MSAQLQYVTDSTGEKTAVLLPLAEYEQLMEDLSDLAAIADRRGEPPTDHLEFVSELRKIGKNRDGVYFGLQGDCRKEL